MKCKDCGAEMKDLAFSVYCPNDCDRKNDPRYAKKAPPPPEPVYPQWPNHCKVPPPGWVCSRPDGHPGPCAAVDDISSPPDPYAWWDDEKTPPGGWCITSDVVKCDDGDPF